jgi:oligosaccharide repeat unit polymerase
LTLWNPRIFFLSFFLFSYLLTQLRLVKQINEFETVTNVIILIGMLSFLLGTYFIKIHKKNTLYNIYYINKKYLHTSFLISFLSMLLLSYEYSQSGIPILGDIELDRLKVQQSGYIHLLAMLFKPILSIYITIIFSYKYIKVSRIDKIILFLLVVTAVILLIVSGSRAHIVLVVLVSFIGLIFIKNIKSIYIILSAFFTLFAISAAKYYRDLAFFGDFFIDSISNNWYFGEKYLIFYSGYTTLTMNFEILNQLIKTFYNESFQFGYFLLLPIISLWPGPQETLGEMQNRIWKTDFHGGLTSTYLGVPYADFGIVGVAVISFLFGYISMYLYKKMIEYQTFRGKLLYSYWVVILLLSLYTYPFGKFYAILFFLVYIYFTNIVYTLKIGENNENTILRKT